MARYWMYLEDHVEGPFAVEQLIRQRGFSRQTLVCVEDASGQPQNWISPADIPELAHIFKAIDEHAADVLPSSPKASTKKLPQARRPFTPAVTLKRSSRFNAVFWGWVTLLVLLAGGGGITWLVQSRRVAELEEQQHVKRLIENVRLSGSSSYGTLGQYLQEKVMDPRWEFEEKVEGLYRASVSWYGQGPAGAARSLEVYAFEVNTQAQIVRALNSAAAKLISGSLAGPPGTSSPKKASKVQPPPSFEEAIDRQLDALSAGDYQTVWDSFSKRKKAEMLRAGMSREGFIRLQTLTHRLESGARTSLIKTKEESAAERLVLLKESSPGRADIFIKQLWVMDGGDWKLDDEQKRSAVPTEPTEVSTPTPVQKEPATRVLLPGMSN